jgi:hypothetical protein
LPLLSHHLRFFELLLALKFNQLTLALLMLFHLLKE